MPVGPIGDPGPDADADAARRLAGGCLCGGIRFVVGGPVRDVYDCHCERCRRFSGHHVAATAADVGQIDLTGEDLLRWYSPDPSVAYGFCSRCGSSLFWKADELGGHRSIMAGALDQPTGLRTTDAWWTAEAGDYFERSPVPNTHAHDGDRD